MAREEVKGRGIGGQVWLSFRAEADGWEVNRQSKDLLAHCWSGRLDLRENLDIFTSQLYQKIVNPMVRFGGLTSKKRF